MTARLSSRLSRPDLLTAPKSMGTGIPNNKSMVQGTLYENHAYESRAAFIALLVSERIWGVSASPKRASDVSECSRSQTGNQARVDMCRAVPDAPETTEGGAAATCSGYALQSFPQSRESKCRDLYFLFDSNRPRVTKHVIQSSGSACDHHHLCLAGEA